MPVITIAKIIRFTDTKKIVLQDEFMNFLFNKDKKNALLILSVNQGVLRCIPTIGSQAIKLYVKIAELVDNFFDVIITIFSNCNVKMLYSSGVCFAGELECYYECFIEHPQSLASMDIKEKYTPLKEVLDKLKKIDGVEDVLYEVIHL